MEKNTQEDTKMTNILRKTLAILLVAVLLVGTLPGVCFVANAAIVDYQYGSVAGYGNIIKNWGTRGELATFLSPNAEAFYEEQGVSYEELSDQAGSSNVDQVVKSELYQALYDLMSGAHTTITDYDDIVNVFCYTDIQGNGNISTRLSGFYSGIALNSQWDKGLTWNREHTWPQSKSAKSDDIEDIMSIRAESSSVNSSRGNTAYGKSTGFYNPSTVSGNTYDLRGDAARIVLYTYVRWGGEMQTIQNNMWGAAGVIESVDVLLEWIEADPVDTWEMGRNDSVESITGTRNVFVDYPELAFVLFDADVPSMPTPSGDANSYPYAISAWSNNDAYGTVHVNHQYVTAHPNPGYRIAGYEVVSGSATVTRNYDVFSINAAGDCTVSILFEAAPEHTAAFLQDGKKVSSVSVEEGNCVVMPAFSGNLPTGYNFVGWVTSVVHNSTTKPANVYPAGAEYIMEENVTFYALLTWVDMANAGEIYKLVTNQAQIAGGKKVVITASGSDRALSTTQNTNNRSAVEIAKGSENTLIFAEGEGVQILTLENSAVSGSYGLYTGSGYLYAASSSGNQLKTKSTLDANGSFKITVNSDGTCTVIAQGTNSKNNLLYNSQSNLFSCYSGTSSNVKTVAIYVAEQGSGAITYTMAWTYDPQEPTEPETTEPTPTECSHANETTVEFVPSCTAQGYTEYYCADCGEYLYTDDYEDALGHTETVTPGYAATLTATGLSDGVHCSVCNEVLEEQQKIPCLASVDSWGLVLSDDLSVKFKIYVDASISANAKIHISMNGFTTTYETKALTAVGENYYYASVNVAAPLMGDTISVRITNGADSSEIKTYSVLEYATKMLADEKQSKYHAVLKEMLNYGAAAQTFFDYKTDALVNENIEDAGAVTVPADATQTMTFTGSAEGISYYGASLVYREKLAVRFYFEGSVEGVTFAYAGNPCEAVSKNNMYYAEVGGILPQNLDQSITLTATDAAGNTFAVTYSPMNYIVRMYAKGNDTQKNLMIALYNYHLAAKALTQA